MPKAAPLAFQLIMGQRISRPLAMKSKTPRKCWPVRNESFAFPILTAPR